MSVNSWIQNDNRISLFVAQKGKCDVTDQELDMDDIHRLIHATNEKIIKNFFQLLNLSNTGLTKLNQLRELVGTSPLLKKIWTQNNNVNHIINIAR